MGSYFAVIFTTEIKPKPEGYIEVAEKMEQLAKQQPGYIGVESVRDGSLGITVSYWQDEASIKAWREQLDHTVARKMGREKWCQYYRVRVCKVERDYEFGERS
jgi:heme-degrading monooxygenase HmoA